MQMTGLPIEMVLTGLRFVITTMAVFSVDASSKTELFSSFIRRTAITAATAKNVFCPLRFYKGNASAGPRPIINAFPIANGTLDTYTTVALHGEKPDTPDTTPSIPTSLNWMQQVLELR